VKAFFGPHINLENSLFLTLALFIGLLASFRGFMAAFVEKASSLSQG